MKKKSRNNINNRKAFSLVETMITLGIVGLVGLMLSKVTYSGSETFKTQRVKDQMRGMNQQISSQLKTDVDLALHVLGATVTQAPGIARTDSLGNLVGPRAASSDNDSLGFYIAKYPEFTLGLVSLSLTTTVPPVSTLHASIMPNLSDSYQFNISRYITKNLESSTYIFLSNPDFLNIAKVSSYTPATVTNGTPIPVDVQTTGYAAGDYALPTSIGIADRVVWTLEGQDLKRKIYRPSGQQKNAGSDTIFSGVTEFRVFYSFSNRRKSAPTLKVPSSKQLLSTPYDAAYIAAGSNFTTPNGTVVSGSCVESLPDTVCCNSPSQTCVDWSDVSRLTVHVTYTDPSGFVPKMQVAGDDGFSIIGNKLALSSTAVFDPTNYNLQEWHAAVGSPSPTP